MCQEKLVLTRLLALKMLFMSICKNPVGPPKSNTQFSLSSCLSEWFSVGRKSLVINICFWTVSPVKKLRSLIDVMHNYSFSFSFQTNGLIIGK